MRNKVLKIILGALIIAAIQYSSMLLISFFNLQFPPAILGMVILFTLLYSKILPIHHVEEVCKFLLDNMVLFFIPVTIGIVLYSDVIIKNFAILAVIILASTFLTMIATAFTVEYFVERKLKEQKELIDG